jgi:hypothetical protein
MTVKETASRYVGVDAALADLAEGEEKWAGITVPRHDALTWRSHTLYHPVAIRRAS